ncbi:ribosome small subunit-dependent GTPase A [Primorskyibacter sedentarius]|uniref:ribosome small subunit-dependent GTPase A n=1 Tax=Primorskyibacter sedentarius TaxID=745311 RepID=UPI001FB2A04B|nr:ribosome small subunit-dependent GTPase A [Primorskyibacter sedentarius]
MSSENHPAAVTLPSLGWASFFEEQLGPDDSGQLPLRVATVHRSRMTGLSTIGTVRVGLPAHVNTAQFAVGDWVLADPQSHLLIRRLERRSLLERQTVGARVPQLIAANLDTVFIVTSCNDDFNPARLERYLALANEAGTRAVIVLTKADQTPDPAPFLEQAAALQRGLEVVSVNARSPDAVGVLAPWSGVGQTVALIGSSGVGKSTLLNTLARKSEDAKQATGAIREDDAKGRHTTTARSLHKIETGGWIIDTPGMRTLHVSDVSSGLETLFAEITERAPDCRFRDCTHMHEPGCAVQAAVAAGELDLARLDRWRKLHNENLQNTPVETGARGNRKSGPRGKFR